MLYKCEKCSKEFTSLNFCVSHELSCVGKRYVVYIQINEVKLYINKLEPPDILSFSLNQKLGMILTETQKDHYLQLLKDLAQNKLNLNYYSVYKSEDNYTWLNIDVDYDIISD